MGITVEFKDFNEMVTFAQVLLNGYKTEGKVVQKTNALTGETKMVPAGTKDEVPFEEEPVKAYTLEEVRAVLAKLTRSGKQKQVKALLTSLGAKNLSSVDPKDYAALMEKAGEI